MSRRTRHVLLALSCAALVAIATLAAPVALGQELPVSVPVPTPSWLGDVPGLGDTAPDPAPAHEPISVSDCTVTNPLYDRSPEDVRSVVPKGYELGSNAFFGPDAATVLAGFLTCKHVRIHHHDTGSAALMLIAVQVMSAPVQGDPVDTLWGFYNRSTLNFLPSSSWYVVSAETNNPALASRLGPPVKLGPVLVTTNDDRTSDRVTGRPFTLATNTMLPDPFIHNHDWFFWHGTGRDRSGFFLHLHGMSDSSCGYNFSTAVQAAAPDCGAVLETRDATIASMLGATPASRGWTAPTPFAFNHPPTHTWGYIDVSRRGRQR